MNKSGQNIRKIRLIKGYTQQKFADLFTISRASLGAYEEGRAEPKAQLLLEIAKKFNIPLERLMAEELEVNDLSGLGNKSIEREAVLQKGKTANLPFHDLDYTSLKGRELIEVFNKDTERRSVPIELLGPHIILRLIGNTMWASGKGLSDGDLLVLRHLTQKRMTQLKVGGIYVILIEECLVIGQLSFDQRLIVLSPLNPFYDEIKLTKEQILDIYELSAFISKKVDFGMKS